MAAHPTTSGGPAPPRPADRPAGRPGPGIELGESDFARLAERVFALTGIVLSAHKRQMVISRLRKRLRPLGLGDLASYIAYLDGPQGADETGALINAVTTNLTAFFREAHHFEDLAGLISRPAGGTAPDRPERQGMAERGPGQPGAGPGGPGQRGSGPGGGAPGSDCAMRGGRAPDRLRIWSAACSTGEEPYSIAITALAARAGGPPGDLRILATDIDTDALAQARAGVYAADRVATCPAGIRRRHFEPLADGRFRVARRARDMVRFNRLNLHHAWPVSGPFDAIFCRNALIYFDPRAKSGIVDRFVELLRPGGTLYLGHSESMLGHHPHLVSEGHTIFRKIA